MKNSILRLWPISIFILLGFTGCAVFQARTREENRKTPEMFNGFNCKDSTNSAQINWRQYFTDPYLTALIDTALGNNQELNILLHEIEIQKNEIRSRKGEYLPFVALTGGAGVEKEAHYTRNGAVDEQLEIQPGKPFPKPLGDFGLGLSASWELDVWKKLRNARKSAVLNYLAGIEGRNFMVTHLISEIAMTYYDLMALDNQLSIVQRNIDVQSNALQTIQQEKQAAKVSQLAVNRFQAQLLNTQNLQYEILQQITETENRLHFLMGKFPGPIKRNPQVLTEVSMDTILAGIPAQLLANRPDIRQAEKELAASRLDIEVAKANFYPSFALRAHTGFQAFNPTYLLNPESMALNFAGDLVAPLVNRNAIRANYLNANERQIQAAYAYEKTILNAYLEVVNELSQIRNYSESFDTKSREVDILTQSITISNNLFRSARADYMEVLLTQRESLESKMELVEIKLKQMQAKVHLYKALGGGWN
jgi:multidrug efflux system outer membrane protein